MQPEAHEDVQLLDPAAYRRALEAAQCGIRATLLLPVFESPARSSCMAVLEVVQTQGMQFELLALALSAVLEVRGVAPLRMLWAWQLAAFVRAYCVKVSLNPHLIIRIFPCRRTGCSPAAGRQCGSACELAQRYEWHCPCRQVRTTEHKPACMCMAKMQHVHPESRAPGHRCVHITVR
jgi:hypothetical protein